jgi:hypothetical protein
VQDDLYNNDSGASGAGTGETGNEALRKPQTSNPGPE